MRSCAATARRQRGFSLIELLIALGILGFIGVAFMLALTGALWADDTVRERVRAENLAIGQIEDIRNQVYADSYPRSVTLPLGYTMTITTADYCTPPPTPCDPDADIQKNTVAVHRGGVTLTRIEDLKMRR